MNKYGQPFTKGSVSQTVLPVMYRSGRFIGYALIASTVFTGNETTFTLPDNVVLPITTVTLDSDPTKPSMTTQFMAAVYSDNLAMGFTPWASEYVLDPYTNGAPYRRWSMPAQGWALNSVAGNLVVAITENINRGTTAPTTIPAPTVSTPQTLFWKTSVAYSALFGECPFFDFDWVTLFNAKSPTQALRIVVNSNPAPIPPSTVSPIVAKVIGIPTTVGAGIILYDTIRLMRLDDTVAAGDYTFNMTVYDDQGKSTPVVMTLTVQ